GQNGQREPQPDTGRSRRNEDADEARRGQQRAGREEPQPLRRKREGDREPRRQRDQAPAAVSEIERRDQGDARRGGDRPMASLDGEAEGNDRPDRTDETERVPVPDRADQPVAVGLAR